MWLFKVVFLFHVVFLLSVFDIYFRSPLISNIDLIENNIKVEAKRLVLIVGDGFRADYLYKYSGLSTSPFLRSVITKGAVWGISHTRVPTESRPGHVAMIAGFYEDPSAVFQGWKENPLPFDSVFNQSAVTFSWGSADTVTMFAKASKTGHIHCTTYPRNKQDLSGITSFASSLDSWILQSFINFTKSAIHDNNKLQLLNKDKVVLFLHLLGIDIAGHSSKPGSLEYDNTIKNMDKVVNQLTTVIQQFYGDNKTTFLFTADHGMTDWGSHGAGSTVETETPFILWGAGVKKPVTKYYSERNLMSSTLRRNINQADLTALMSIILGTSIPIHSVGVLPLGMLKFENPADEAKAFLLNARQLHSQFKAKENDVKHDLVPWLFVPYTILSHPKDKLIIMKIEEAITAADFNNATSLTQELIDSILSGIDYYQRYFQNVLLFLTAVTFIGLMTIIIREILYFCDSPELNKFKQESSLLWKFGITGWFIVLLCLAVVPCIADGLPIYILTYVLIPLFLWYWILITNDWNIKVCALLYNKKAIILICVYFCGIQLLVLAFFYRWILSVGLVCISVWPFIDPSFKTAWHFKKTLWLLSCMLLAIFPMMPTVANGKEVLAIKIIAGLSWIGVSISSLLCGINTRHFTFFNQVTKIQLALTPICIWNISYISYTFSDGKGLYLLNQLLSYAILIIYLGIMPFGSSHIYTRFFNLSYSMSMAFLMFCSSYEAVFPCALAGNLALWISLEKHTSTVDLSSENLMRALSLQDIRRSFFFIYYIVLSFFGIGNIASINSFDTLWVRGFVTVFSPFFMMILILLKTVLPFLLVTCAFRFVINMTCANAKALFSFVLLFCDIMALQFLFSVKNTGSWLEIGTSISHFVIMETIVLFLLILYYIAKCLIPSKNSYIETYLPKWRTY